VFERMRFIDFERRPMPGTPKTGRIAAEAVLSSLRPPAIFPGMDARERNGNASALHIALERSRRWFDEVFDCVWFRKTYHFFAGGALLLSLAVLNSTSFLLICIFWLAVFLALSKRISTVMLGLFFLQILTGSKFVVQGAAVIFVAGDGMAAICGTAFGVRRWPWSENKTILGSAAFLMAAFLAMAGMLRFTTHAATGNVFLLAFLPSLVGCVAEALPLRAVRDIRDSKPDDNLIVVLASGAALLLLA
jgi:hypothetical protein